jgi:hypothetical protein
MGSRMKRQKLIALIENGACIAVTGFVLILFPSSIVNAQQPPSNKCVAVYNIEYKAAKREKLLRTKAGMYVRTGRLLRRYYWYCRW